MRSDKLGWAEWVAIIGLLLCVILMGWLEKEDELKFNRNYCEVVTNNPNYQHLQTSQNYLDQCDGPKLRDDR